MRSRRHAAATFVARGSGPAEPVGPALLTTESYWGFVTAEDRLSMVLLCNR